MITVAREASRLYCGAEGSLFGKSPKSCTNNRGAATITSMVDALCRGVSTSRGAGIASWLWILAGTANGYLKTGEFVQVGNAQMPGGKQDGTAGDASVSGVNKMLNTLLTAAGVTKAGGAASDDFGEPSLPKGIFSQLL